MQPGQSCSRIRDFDVLCVPRLGTRKQHALDDRRFIHPFHILLPHLKSKVEDLTYHASVLTHIS